jgi:phage-related protein
VRRKIIAFGNYYNDFVKTLNPKELQKLKYLLALFEISDRMPLRYIRHIREEIYELRMEYNSNIYRLFFIFDNDCIVVIFNGFQKKTQKTPQNEIDKAIRIKKEYYEYKQSLNNRH